MRLLLILLIFLQSYSIKASNRDSSNAQMKIGIRYSLFYNCKVIHHGPDFSLDLGNHNFYLGFGAARILKSPGDPEDKYDKISYGPNFGYRYLFGNKQRKIVLFLQINFSIFKVKYTEFQKGPPFSSRKEKLSVENTASFGIIYNLRNHVQIFSGAGFGSNQGFFLLTSSILPTGFFGLEYKF